VWSCTSIPTIRLHDMHREDSIFNLKFFFLIVAVLNKSHIESTTHMLQKQKLPDTKEQSYWQFCLPP